MDGPWYGTAYLSAGVTTTPARLIRWAASRSSAIVGCDTNLALARVHKGRIAW